MTHQNIASLKAGDQVAGIYLVKDVEVIKGRFVKFLLQDASGTIPVHVWELSLSQEQSKYRGRFIQVKGIVKNNSYDKPYINSNVSQVSKAGQPHNISDYVPVIADNIKEIYLKYIIETIDSVEDHNVRAILGLVYKHENSVDLPRLKASPCDTKRLRGGLLYYLYYGLKACLGLLDAFADSDARPNRDYLIAAWLLHCISIPDKYRLNSFLLEENEEFKLLNISIVSYARVQQLYIATESLINDEIPEEIKLRINHCLTAVSGMTESQSPEAKILLAVKGIKHE